MFTPFFNAVSHLSMARHSRRWKFAMALNANAASKLNLLMQARHLVLSIVTFDRPERSDGQAVCFDLALGDVAVEKVEAAGVAEGLDLVEYVQEGNSGIADAAVATEGDEDGPVVRHAL
ncbi:hypothetical protein ACIBHX_16225 [Nonomuraea sp. NPDC050536]|uniref:hypothetical protein n=1 Tax=Nonomuraea sp. NPDC050536 TaxID=3364366 RepID=UPI0037C98177